MTYVKRMETYHSVQDLFAHHLSTLLVAESILREHSELVWFVQPAAAAGAFAAAGGETDWRAVVTYVKGVLETVQNGCRDMLGVSVSFAVCRGAVGWDDIGREFGLLRAALKQSAFLGRAMAVLDLGVPDGLYEWETDNGAEAQTPEFRKSMAALLKLLQAGAGREAAELTTELFARLKSEPPGHYMRGLECYYALLLAVVSHMNDTALRDMPSGDIRIASLPVMELPADWDSAERQLVELVNLICRQKKEQLERGENRLCERIHRYIRDNLGGDLSLARIAEAVFFNPSYLSRYYKQVTGRNLSDYIQSAKIEAAMDMLAEPQLKIGEIASRLGFESPSYFAAFFRKAALMSPQEYRDSRLHRK